MVMEEAATPPKRRVGPGEVPLNEVVPPVPIPALTLNVVEDVVPLVM